MSLYNEFEELKTGLKNKWLDYYESNSSWIEKFSGWNSSYGCERPNASFILGVVSFLEPKLIDYFIPLLDINRDGEQVVKVLGLNFDPRPELKKRADKYHKSVTDIKRLYYFFLVSKPRKSDIIVKLLGIYFVLQFDYKKHLKDLEKCSKELTKLQEAVEQLNHLEQTSTTYTLFQPYTDPDVEYLNKIREQIQKENANL